MDTAYTGPYGVQIGVTGDCNYSCRFCGLFSALNVRPDNKDDSKKRMTLAEFKRLTDMLREMEVQQISIVGWGEPLTHPDIAAMVRYVKTSRMKCMITTNASLLTRGKVIQFIEAGLDVIYISLNAGGSRTYREIHGIRYEGAFDKIRDVLKNLSYIKLSRGISAPVLGIRMIICKDNFREVGELFAAADEVGADSVILQEWSRFESKEPLALDRDEIKGLLRELNMIKMNINHDIQHNIDYFETRLSALLTDTGSEEHSMPAYPCYAGWMYAMILHNGNVLPCCNCNKVMGNIYDNDFSEIWSSEQYQEFRRQTVNIINIPYRDEGCSCYITCGSAAHNKRMYEMMAGVRV